MRPRLIVGVPGLDDPALTPFERFETFARMIVSVPKEEADKVVDEGKGGRRAAPRIKRQESDNGKNDLHS